MARATCPESRAAPEPLCRSARLRAPSPCSRQPLSRSPQCPSQSPLAARLPSCPRPRPYPCRPPQGLGATARPPGSCSVSAFLWFQPHCRAVRGSVPVLKFLSVPAGRPVRVCSCAGAEEAAPAAPVGHCRQGWEAHCPPSGRSGASDTGACAACPRPPPQLARPSPPADEQGVERPAAQAALPLRGTARRPGPPEAPPGRPVCSLVPGGLRDSLAPSLKPLSERCVPV